MPEVRRDVFAGIDGMVEQVPVSHGDMVERGQILARQRSVELEEQSSQLHGEYAETLEEIKSLDRQRQKLDRSQSEEVDIEEITGRIGQLQETRLALDDQLALLKEKQELLTVTSPINGKVVTWKVRELIENRPVRKGQRLMEIADPSSHWELEIFVPEAKMGHVVERLQKLRADDSEAQLEVTFILATHSDEKLQGKVYEIGYQRSNPWRKWKHGAHGCSLRTKRPQEAGRRPCQRVESGSRRQSENPLRPPGHRIRLVL